MPLYVLLEKGEVVAVRIHGPEVAEKDIPVTVFQESGKGMKGKLLDPDNVESSVHEGSSALGLIHAFDPRNGNHSDLANEMERAIVGLMNLGIKLKK